MLRRQSTSSDIDTRDTSTSRCRTCCPDTHVVRPGSWRECGLAPQGSWWPPSDTRMKSKLTASTAECGSRLRELRRASRNTLHPNHTTPPTAGHRLSVCTQWEVLSCWRKVLSPRLRDADAETFTESIEGTRIGYSELLRKWLWKFSAGGKPPVFSPFTHSYPWQKTAPRSTDTSPFQILNHNR